MQQRYPIVLVEPELNEVLRIVNRAFSKYTIMIVGRCRVNYLGRAKSKLEPGERILIIKKDGSVLIHRSTGYEPVNWQPPGCVLHASVVGEGFEIRAIRRKPVEEIRISFDKLQLVSVVNMEDAGRFSLFASEEDMQKAILLEPSLLEEGFKPVDYEKKSKRGFLDIYGIDNEGAFVIVEIKRNRATKEAVTQLSKYVENMKTRTNRKLRGIIVAPSLAKDVRRALEVLGLEFKQLDPKKCAQILVRIETKQLAEFFHEA